MNAWASWEPQPGVPCADVRRVLAATLEYLATGYLATLTWTTTEGTKPGRDQPRGAPPTCSTSGAASGPVGPDCIIGLRSSNPTPSAATAGTATSVSPARVDSSTRRRPFHQPFRSRPLRTPPLGGTEPRPIRRRRRTSPQRRERCSTQFRPRGPRQRPAVALPNRRAA